MATRKSVFTQHVRDLVRGDVTREELEAAWQKLRDALTAEMRKRALLALSPACLGVYGFSSWTEEALDELAADCYTSVFLRRLSSLAAQLERKANVEGLVFSNIRYYLHEIQRKHDPLGFRIYTALRAAARAALDRGALRIEDGDPEVRNDTVLSLSRSSSGERKPARFHFDDPNLTATVGRWADELLPDLVTARGAALDPIVDELADRLPRLADHGVGVFSFRDIAKLLKDQVRRRWGALWAGDASLGELDCQLEDLARVVRPPAAFEEREAFEKLVACVSEALEAVPTSPRTRSYLHRLWVFLWSHSIEENGALPSQRRLSEMLDIPRARLAELYATVGRTVELCCEVSSGKKTSTESALKVRQEEVFR